MNTYRVYYNRSTDFPNVWSFDKGDISTECIVKKIRMEPGCVLWSNFDPEKNNLTEPRAWFTVMCGHVEVTDDGVAYFLS
jgi:hypothetical protein